MLYTLITATGKIYTFNVLGVAELYKHLYGGFIRKEYSQLELVS